MPAGVLASPLLAAGATAAGGIAGGLISRSGYNRGSDAQLEAQREALAFEREQAALEQQRYEEEQRRLDEAYLAYQQFRAPFRNMGLSILQGYGANIPESAWQTPAVRPPGWEPGMAPTASPLGQAALFADPVRRTPTTSQTIAQMMKRYG